MNDLFFCLLDYLNYFFYLKYINLKKFKIKLTRQKSSVKKNSQNLISKRLIIIFSITNIYCFLICVSFIFCSKQENNLLVTIKKKFQFKIGILLKKD